MMNEHGMKRYMKRLYLSRNRILRKYPFFGMMLMYLNPEVVPGMATASTNGKWIRFSPEYIDEMSDERLDFLFIHELLHVVLGHICRGDGLNQVIYNLACDIVVNSTILGEPGLIKNSDKEKYEHLYHLTPSGEEGRLYSAEEVYHQIAKLMPLEGCGGKKCCNEKNRDSDGNGDGDSDNDNNSDKDQPCDAKKCPFQGKGMGIDIDNHSDWDRKPDKEADELSRLWKRRVILAAFTIERNERYQSTNCGDIPLFAKRIVEEIANPQIDWRTILIDFVQEEINDYSFSPPDKRIQDAGFFLPDFNSKDEEVRNILFMIDTSGSMTSEEISAAFSEVFGAIEQFGGGLSGWLGFFDAEVKPAIAFEDVDDLLSITPVGGGGTSFKAIFEYVAESFKDDTLSSIIIMTDGYAGFPNESAANGIPVLWLMTNHVVTPPWGKTARIEV